MVTAMNFSGNKLETLPAGLFGALDKLLVIDLSFNQVQILSSEVGGDLSGSLRRKGFKQFLSIFS